MSRVQRNEALLLDAAASVLADEGWSGLNFAHVAATAGLSVRPIRDRFATVSELAVAVWHGRVGAPLRDSLSGGLTAAGLLVEPGSPTQAVKLLRRSSRPSAQLRAAGELLLMAQFDQELGQAVDATLGAQVRSWCEPQRAVVTRADAARRAYLVATTLGLILAGRRPGMSAIDLTPEIDDIMRAIDGDRQPQALPKDKATYLLDEVPFNTGDRVLDALLRAVLDEVGECGFEGTTTARIVARAGCSEGALFGRYRTKLELFLDATKRQNEPAILANGEFMRSLGSRFGAGVAEAVTIREWQRPHLAQKRAIEHEQLRISWHDAQLKKSRAELLRNSAPEFVGSHVLSPQRVVASVHMGFAVGLGVIALPLLMPDCWSLPYDVVTVGLYPN